MEYQKNSRDIIFALHCVLVGGNVKTRFATTKARELAARPSCNVAENLLYTLHLCSVVSAQRSMQFCLK